MVGNRGRCVIVSASPQVSPDFIKSRLRTDDFVICADAGADAMLKVGVKPNLIIGDFDSAKFINRFNDVEIVTLPAVKDDTDTMYCVKYALHSGFKDFLFLNATGGRTDHTLANLSCLLFLRNNGASGMISDQYNDISLLEKGDNVLYNLKERTISVMPFACENVCLSYIGMMYPLNKSTVTADYPYSISNVVLSDAATVTVHSGNALLILPALE